MEEHEQESFFQILEKAKKENDRHGTGVPRKVEVVSLLVADQYGGETRVFKNIRFGHGPSG